MSTMPSADRVPFKHLPQSVVPELYQLTLTPDLTAFTFRGDLKVTVAVNEAVSEILLNAVDLQVHKASWRQADSQIEAIVSLNPAEEKLHVSLPKPIALGSGELWLSYSGTINDQMKGFYRSKGPGEDTYTTLTQFEAIDARRALPCWDEPAFKAQFEVTIVADEGRTILSNTDEVSNTPSTEFPGKKVVKFERTPKMSTYLLAWAIGDFDFIEDRDSNGVKVRVFTPKGKAEHGRAALEVAKRTIPFYTEFFGIEYPLSKCDMLAVGDFAAGAMENWGLITYRAEMLLVDPESPNMSTKQWMAIVVGHEIAHQWFGNLVTMTWWTDLWLNEGFASWIEFLLVDHVHPEYQIWLQYITMALTRAMSLDSLRSSHPVEVEIEHPSDVDEVFDNISYDKGSVVVRMLFEFLGSEKFRKGLSSYLHHFKYSNAITVDLWNHLGQASGLDVAGIMGTWTKQMGYPVLTVEQEVQGTDRVFTVSQRRFLLDGSSDEENQLWSVPVSITTASSPDKPVHRFVLDKPSQKITVSDVSEKDWVNFNPGFVGMYHVVYPKDLLSALLTNISELSVESKMSLLFDSEQLAKSGSQSTVELLKLINSMKDESNYTVWCSMLIAVKDVQPLAFSAGALDKLKQFTIALCETKAQQIGWENNAGGEESHLTVLLRELLLSALGKAGHPATVQEARSRFKAHVDGSNIIPSDLRQCVYATLATNGDEGTLDQFLQLYRNSSDVDERPRLLHAMGLIPDKAVLQKAFAFALTDEVSTNKITTVISPSTSNPALNDQCWEFFKTNHQQLLKAMGCPSMLFTRLVQVSTINTFNEQMMTDVKAFFQANPHDAVGRTLDQSEEKCKLRVAWIARDKQEVASYLNSL
jgi:puromycin-sensitive aminopeptidase